MPNPRTIAGIGRVGKLAIVIFAVVIALLAYYLISYNLWLASLSQSSTAVETGPSTPTTPPQPPPYIPSCFSQGPNISISSGSTYECILANMPTSGCTAYISLYLTSSAPVNVEISDENGYVAYQWSGTTYINQEIELSSPSQYSDTFFLKIYNPNGYTVNVYLSYSKSMTCSG